MGEFKKTQQMFFHKFSTTKNIGLTRVKNWNALVYNNSIFNKLATIISC